MNRGQQAAFCLIRKENIMSNVTLENAVEFVEANFVLPELQNQAAQNAGLLINPYAEFNAVANAEAKCYALSLRPVDVGKGGYTCELFGHKYTKGKFDTKDNALYKKLMDAEGMTALYDLSVATVLNAIKKFVDRGEVSKENCAAFYADEKNEKRIQKLRAVKSCANAVIKYAAPTDTDSDSDTDTDTDTDTDADIDAPTVSEFIAKYELAIRKATENDLSALDAKAILEALHSDMTKEFLKTAGINSASWEAAQNSKIKKTA